MVECPDFEGHRETLHSQFYALETETEVASNRPMATYRLGGRLLCSEISMVEGLDFVLIGGSWIIANQYLVVQKWRPNFVPREEEIQTMPVWVRLSKLPREWINADLLLSIEGLLARDRFSRICVEIDITKPLKGSLNVEEKSIRVEYENLGLICFNCGRVGYSKDGYTMGKNRFIANPENVGKSSCNASGLPRHRAGKSGKDGERWKETGKGIM
ncbi:hypothetical protein Dsin_029991, partial [Dipteronia sinensis]